MSSFKLLMTARNIEFLHDLILAFLTKFVIPNPLPICSLGFIPSMQFPQVLLEFLGHVDDLLDMLFVQYNLPILIFVVVVVR